MANTIKIKRSGTATQVPVSLEYGELAINYADGKLFYRNTSNQIVELSSSGSISISATPEDIRDVKIIHYMEVI
jgi:hypothetical protein